MSQSDTFSLVECSLSNILDVTRGDDDAKLIALYGTEKFGGPENFEIIRDDDIFNSVC